MGNPCRHLCKPRVSDCKSKQCIKRQRKGKGRRRVQRRCWLHKLASMVCAQSNNVKWSHLPLTESKAAFIVHLLTLGAFMNAAYTFHRRRHYRLFESSVDAVPSTSSAHRVRVNSSPIASSPLRFLSNMLAGESANARAHPDASRDVWEIAVWDPTPISLRMFCLFSPGHVLVYWLFLPTAISDPRPSTTVITTMILAGLLSAQLLLLQSNFSQQSKDASVIHKEVMNEYDTKYVHPRTQPLMRDVGTQYSTSEAVFNWSASRADLSDSVDVYPPTFIINRGFHTKPNPAYARYVDPEGSSSLPHQSRGAATRFTSAVHTPLHLRDASSPIRPQTTIRQPQFRPNGVGDGGSLGVFSHANSPLRKSASVNFSGSYERQERSSSPVKRESSPMKRGSLAPMPNGRRSGHMPDSTTRRESGKY